MRFLFILLLFLPAWDTAHGLATDLLYTGNALTVPPGKYQLQSYFNGSFGGPQRLAGGSLTTGIADNIDARAGYGYLWNNIGPNVRLGPNAGIKWRFLGDGLVKPGYAISGLIGTGGGTSDVNYGSLFIAQYPTRPIIYLLNVGHVWVGNPNRPNFLYTSFAAGSFTSKHTLFALQYSSINRLRSSRLPKKEQQYAAAVVYLINPDFGYIGQLSYLPEVTESHMRITFGVSISL